MLNENEECYWMLGGKLDEHLFCEEFVLKHNIVFMDGHFYCEKGIITDEGSIRRAVYEELVTCTRSNLARKVDSIMQTLRISARRDIELDHENKIHLANGTYDLYDGYREQYHLCRHRLPALFTNSNGHSEAWEKFLSELLEPEDILTLQEYMGYCLLPSNRAQKMLIILGNGGEGKSRIGVVMKAIFGQSMHVGSIAKLENNNFAKADLENVLVMVDDDLRLDALHSTNTIKSLISAEVPVDVERKYQQSYQANIHARFLAFGNGTLEALHDRSYGFYRRQIILTAKPRDPKRVDDPYLGETLAADRDHILIWCLKGLYRLLAQNYQFTVSAKAKENWQQNVTDQNNIVAFMESQGYFRIENGKTITAKRLYELYRLWCEDNALKPLCQRTFSSYLIGNQAAYGIHYCNNVPIADGKKARGFMGITPQMQGFGTR